MSSNKGGPISPNPQQPTKKKPSKPEKVTTSIDFTDKKCPGTLPIPTYYL